MSSRPRVVLVGEGMLELSANQGAWRLGYGGDTLNTAIHLARLGCSVAYLTAIGSDPFSADLRAAWGAEGLDTSLVLTHPRRQPGLYAIRTDEGGERSFFYWREASAARQMLALSETEAALAQARTADLLAFSLITLAILPPGGRKRLLDLCRRVRAHGGRVAFDGNYRPRLWASTDEARAARDAGLRVSDIGLPTLEDERALSGEPDAHAVAAHWSSNGVGEVVVRLGADGCLADGCLVPTPSRLAPVDTSGAGDAFNAGYLAARLQGLSPTVAALAGHRLAGWVVTRPGAVPPRDEDAPYT